MSLKALAPLLAGEPCSPRALAARRLGAQRRRLFLAGALLSLVVPVAPYLTGAWETAWYALAATEWWLPLRVTAFLVGFHLALSAAALPLGYYGGFVLGHAFGLSRQTRRAWLADWLRGLALSVTFGVLVGGLFLLSVAVLGSGWWWGYALAMSAGMVLLTFVMPYVLVPIFFKMRPLEDAATVARIQSLAQRAGARVRDVCTLDFSRRTAEANAAVIGMGRSRRVVLADTLLATFDDAQVDAVVAHEVGHHVHRDVPRLIVANLALLWVGLAAAAWVVPGALPVLSIPSLTYVPGYPALFAVAELFGLLTLPLANWWSRRLETSADRFALRLTADPAAFAGAMRRLACQNLIELRPPRWSELLLGSHPAVYRRVALAEQWSPT